MAIAHRGKESAALPSKVIPPEIARYFPRKRLFRLLDAARKRPVVWISAPPGAGKTTLASSHIDVRRLPCLWQQVDERDGDVATFFYYMGLAVQRAAPRKRKPMPLLTPGYLPGLPAFTHRYFDELFSRLPVPSVVVFDIYQLSGAKAAGACKAYLVKGRKKNLMIDTGLPSDAEAIKRQLLSLGLAIEDVHIVALTHEHIDHIGGVPSFPSRTVVAAHAMAANKIGLQDEFVLMGKALGHKVDDFHIDVHLHHGTLIDVGGYVLQSLHTPGHCSGSVCLYEPEQQLLFTGDTIFAGGTLGGIFPSGNISDYVGTLRQLRNMKVKELYPGHGRISTEPEADFARAIRASIQLMSDTRTLFGVLDSRAEFGYIMKSIAAYSRRV